MKRLFQRMNKLGVDISDAVSRFVGTWTFVGIYTLSMLAWIVLHVADILHIDNSEFMRWNLWLSYFAGTQASLVLMSSSRRAYQDRQKAQQNFELDQKTLEVSEDTSKRILELIEQIEELEEIVDKLIEEKNGKSTEEDREDLPEE